VGRDATTFLVRPTPKGTWRVRREEADEPVSEHASATEAERVAVVDRYMRCRELP
jgi:hypothetical protein